MISNMEKRLKDQHFNYDHFGEHSHQRMEEYLIKSLNDRIDKSKNELVILKLIKPLPWIDDDKI